MLYLFDIDGTLIRSFLREGDAEHDYDDVELLPRRNEAIADLIASNGSEYVGFGLVTNQAGVAMGYQTVEQVHAKLAVVVRKLGFFDGCPFSIHVCFYHPEAKLEEWRMDPCPRRKPGPGMIREAIDAHRVLPAKTLFVGDLDSDREAAEAAGVAYRDAGWFFEDGITF